MPEVIKQRVAIYARVSTSLQTTDNQILDLQNFCRIRGWTIKRIFQDSDISGTQTQRPQLDEMMGLIRRHQFDAMLVWRLDRLARSAKHLILTLDEFRQVKVDFISFQENIDTSTSQGRLFFTILSGFAEFERDLIRERIMSGLRRARLEGKRFGRPPIPEELRQLILSHRGTYSSRQIAGLTGASPATVKRVLALNPVANAGFSIVETVAGF